ncbi:MAG TPA: M12 family metallo-peptidase, partial [Phycisphaerales bacterium]|nr:M12 family metallo-peptidase [Phycisphaerales bacterium]
MKCPSRLARFMSAMVLVGGMGAPALAQDSPLGIPDPAPISIPAGSVLDTMIRAKLHLRQYSVADLTVQQLADGQVRIPVSLGGEAVTLALAPHSLRGDHFQVVTIGADGNQVAVEAPPASTFKGVAGGLEGSRVRASVRDGQVTALVILPDGGIWGIQPATAADPEAPAGLHIIFRDSDAEPMNRVCGVLPDAHDHSDEPQVGGDEGGALRGTGIKIADIALDADFEFYGLNGSSVPNTVNDMENVLNNVEGIYETAVQITFEITTVVVRTAEPDPYTTTNPGALLGQFQSWWNTNQALVRRDYAHLFTGKNIDGGVIGIASLGVVCNTSNAYGLAQSRFSLNMISRTCLSAHEMGHNWSAQHCDGPTTCAIMCSVLGGCPGGCQDFSTPERTQINNHRNSRTCLLDLRDPVTPAFNDQILSIDPVRWSFNFGALASSLSVNPPTPPLALQLNSSSANPNGNDDLRTNYIHMAGMGTGQLRYHVQHRGVEAGETLTVEVWTSQVRWQVVNTITSDGIDQTSFT